MFLDDDKLHEECGVFGISGVTDEAAAHTALGLHALQHRGQEAAGVVSFDGNQFFTHRALGLVGDNFNKQSTIERLKGHMAIGHNRYSTSGEPHLRNVQPLFAEFSFGGLALAHNGNLTNAYTLREELIKGGAIFQSTSDTEVMIHLIARSKKASVADRIIDGLKQIQGAYSLVALSHDGMVGVRDPHGVRPLVLGTLGNAYVLASESCALDIIGATLVRDIEAGEMVVIKEGEITSYRPFDTTPEARTKSRFCVFEYIYFARPDSYVDNNNVYTARKAIGTELAREALVEADLVAPVPDSGLPAAIGYAEAAGLPFELGIIRNHYVGRTFIEPTDQVRHLGVKLKHNANRVILEGKRVILVDDSIVRGTTSQKIVNMVREAGAKEVHMRIASPPTTHSCFYGVDTPSRDKLLAANKSIEEMAEHIGVDSLAFISIDGVYRALGKAEGRNNESPEYCDACFTGEYAIPLTDQEAGKSGKTQADLFKTA
ncbi:MAG: amidophosphoribosyltransferase [Rickettsiales bacterium]|nr:amidophosphoribosyltransferase [Rickettsiales bacterium]